MTWMNKNLHNFVLALSFRTESTSHYPCICTGTSAENGERVEVGVGWEDVYQYVKPPEGEYSILAQCRER